MSLTKMLRAVAVGCSPGLIRIALRWVSLFTLLDLSKSHVRSGFASRSRRNRSPDSRFDAL